MKRVFYYTNIQNQTIAFFQILQRKFYHLFADFLTRLFCTFRKPVLDIIDAVKLDAIGIQRHQNGAFILAYMVVARCVLHRRRQRGDNFNPTEWIVCVL